MPRASLRAVPPLHTHGHAERSLQGAGLYQVQFRATSSADAFYNIEEGMAYEVLENWSSEGALTVQFNPAF